MVLLKFLFFAQILEISADFEMWSSHLCHLINTDSQIQSVGIYQSNINRNSTDLAEQILSELEPSKTVELGKSDNLDFGPEFIIYFLDSTLTSLHDAEDFLITLPYKCKTLIVFEHTTLSCPSNLMYRMCKGYSILHFNLVITCFFYIFEKIDSIYLTYFPIEENFEIIYNPKSLSRLFPEKSSNLFGKPFPVSIPYLIEDFNGNGVLDEYGNGMELYKIILKKLNATSNITLTEDLTDILEKLYADNFPLIIVDIALPQHLLNSIDFTYPYFLNEVFLYIPMKKKLFNFDFLAQCIGSDLMFYFLMTFLCSILISKILIFRNQSILVLIFNFIQLILQGSSTFEVRRLYQCLFVFSIICCAFLFQEMFRTLVILKLLLPDQTSTLSTVDEVINSNYTIYALSELYDYVNEYQQYPKLPPAITIVTQRKINLLQNNWYTLTHSALCTVELDKKLMYINAHFSKEDYLHKVPESIMKFQIAKFLRKNSPFTHIINDLWMRVFESGILQNHLRLWPFGRKLQNGPPIVKMSLSFEELNVVFIIAGIGYIVAFGVFLLEIVLNKFQRRLENVFILLLRKIKYQ